MTARTILFDANPMATPRMSGVGFYARGLVQALAKAGVKRYRFVGHYFTQGHDPSLLPQADNISYRPSKLWDPKVINQLRRQGIDIPIEILARTRADFILYPAFFGPPSLRRAPMASVIHDVTYLDHPEQVAKRNRQDLERFVPKAIKRSSFSVAVSEFSKQRIMQAYPDIVKDVIVTPVPVNQEKFAEQRPVDLKEVGITKPFMLFVGNIEPRKNLANLATAYTKLPPKLRKQYSLVLAGGAGWNNQETVGHISGLQKQGYDIIRAGYTDDATLTELYSQATILCLPSTYEGFGMPILEAMHLGVPTTVSDIPVFHEVAGKATVYFDPLDPDDIAQKIGELLLSDNKRRKLIGQGKRQVQKFNWDDVAHRVLERIEQAL